MTSIRCLYLWMWTAHRMADARENQSLADEDLLKRPCWHGINYALLFIVSRHRDRHDGLYCFIGLPVISSSASAMGRGRRAGWRLLPT
ncbi:MAG: hypothetical protein IKN15_13020 [Bacteroidaceae bacterium]|nr:hypothetical protein [Bacteroidaceae bacterium]